MKNTTNLKGHLAVLTANFIFGVNFSAVKYITPNLMTPIALNICRVLVTVLLLWILVIIKREDYRIQKQDVARLLACAFSGIVLNQILFIKGLALTFPIHAALLILCTPIFVSIISIFIQKEIPKFYKVIGLTMGLTGAIFLVSSRETSAYATNPFLGNILVAFNAVSYAIYLVAVKPLMLKYHPIVILAWLFTIGSLFMAAIGFNDFLAIQWNDFTKQNLLCLGFIVLGATFTAYLLNIYGVKQLGATITSTYIYTQPIFAAMLSVFLMNEKISTTKCLAAITIFTGVYLISSTHKKSN
jgi:drug/metabolite transporter (DMT)-like permease